MVDKHSNSKAFTLIELLVVLVIITIGAVISVPRITTGIDTAKFRNAVSEVVTYLRNTHLDAILEKKDITVSINYEQNVLQRNDDQFFNIPPDIVLNPSSIGEQQVGKFIFYNNGRGSGPKIEFLGSNARKAVVYVDLISGLAKFDLD
ncbi:Tfp pilus assembly protein FimT [Candidatus Scalindua japonica]|uniref:Tfp pilus assembly protein FimT n=1 Tax=Candidatus Scalindua japonica TaxID=1284222 RepID=A0A286TUD9_9BACT|nr:prepilin-type N-terminal cleavage/methylation domain-containing protein [Candidatus Scalindua japonica]GAX59474.1 Tfp pilus assembly protein FimT [Candidatus Scalindua japonica]